MIEAQLKPYLQTTTRMSADVIESSALVH